MIDEVLHPEIEGAPLMSLPMEMGALCSMMLSLRVKASIVEMLDSSDFWRPAHKLIFKTLSGIDGELDDVRLKEAFGKRLAEVGGTDYLAEVLSFVPSASLGMRYAGEVKSLSNRRKLEAEADRLKALARDLERPLAEHLPRHQTILHDLSKSGVKEEEDWVWMNTVEPKQPEWGYRPILARGMMTLLEGNPGDGKSCLAAAIAGAVTRGRCIPGLPDQDPPKAGAAVMLCAEDSLSFSLAARLRSVDADSSRVIACEGPFMIDSKGIKKIERMFIAAKERAEGGPIFFSIDPIMAYMGKANNTNQDNEVRETLKDLFSLTAEFGVLPLAATHMNKGSDMALHRVMGSVAFSAMPRIVMMAGRDPDQQDRMVLAWVKSNIGPRFKSLGYSIDEDERGWVRFLWASGGSSVSADDMAAPRLPNRKKPAPKAEECKVWLLSTLANCALRYDALEERAEEAGYKPRMLYEIRADLNIEIKNEPKKPGEKGRPFTWWALQDFDWKVKEQEWNPQPDLVEAGEYDPYTDS